MSSPQIGDTRIINHPGNIRKTINGVTKYKVGEVFQVRQTYQVVQSLNNFLGRDYLVCQWVDTEFVE